MAPSALYFSVVRSILRHRTFFNGSIAPFLQNCHPFTMKWVLSEQPRLQRVALAARSQHATSFEQLTAFQTGSSNKYLADLIRLASTAAPNEATTTGLEALVWLEMLRERAALNPQDAAPQRVAQVGDIVVRADIAQRGVVAAVLPFCFQSPQWVEQYLGSLSDRRLRAPWYLVLVEHSESIPLDFTRYASSLTHYAEQPVADDTITNLELGKKQCPSAAIGLHRFLPLFFKGFDAELGRYVPHTEADLAMSSVRWKTHYGPGHQRQLTSVDHTVTQGSQAVAGHE